MPHTSTRLVTAPPMTKQTHCSLRPTLNPASHPLLPAPRAWPPYPPPHPGAFAPLWHGPRRQLDAAESSRPAAMEHPSFIRPSPGSAYHPLNLLPVPPQSLATSPSPEPHQSSYAHLTAAAANCKCSTPNTETTRREPNQPPCPLLPPSPPPPCPNPAATNSAKHGHDTKQNPQGQHSKFSNPGMIW